MQRGCRKGGRKLPLGIGSAVWSKPEPHAWAQLGRFFLFFRLSILVSSAKVGFSVGAHSSPPPKGHLKSVSVRSDHEPEMLTVISGKVVSGNVDSNRWPAL